MKFAWMRTAAVPSQVTMNGAARNGVAYFRSSVVAIVGGKVQFTIDFSG